MMSFRRHFGFLRDHLLVIVASLDRDSSDLDHVTSQLSDSVFNQLEDPQIVDTVFDTLNQCLTWVEPGGDGRGRKKAESKSGGGCCRDNEEMDEADEDTRKTCVENKVCPCVLISEKFFKEKYD